MDFDRVYPSDMKKMVKWYASLKKNEIEIKLSEPPEEEKENGVPDQVSPAAEATGTEEKPKKKTTRKKKTE